MAKTIFKWADSTKRGIKDDTVSKYLRKRWKCRKAIFLVVVVVCAFPISIKQDA